MANESKVKLAGGISAFLRNLNNKEERLEALRRMKPMPPIENLKIVFETATEREDYETCDAIKDYLKENGLEI